MKMISASGKTAFGICCLAVLLGACEQPGTVGSASQALYPKTAKLWHKPQIQVCWESQPDTWIVEKGWVQDALAQTWEEVSQVQFQGWQTCRPGTPGIHIGIVDARPHAQYLGIDLDGVTDGVMLNFTYDKWGQSCAGIRESCIRIDAVHEFGHALGWAHEQNRGDTPSSCTDAPQGDDGDLFFDYWDAYSIMNYCNADYKARIWKGVETISSSDVRGVQYLYGAKPGTIGAYWGKCLDAARPDNGGLLQTWDCTGDATHQKWYFELSSFTSAIVNHVTFRLVDSPGASQANGTRLQVWDRSGFRDAQQWYLAPAMIHGHAAKCLDVPNGNFNNGTPVQMYRCWGGPPQRWTLDASGRLHVGNKCLEVDSSNSGNGGQPRLWDCDGTRDQSWTLRPGGAITASNGKCLDVNQWDTSDGAVVQLWDCNGGVNQHWSFRGPITHGAQSNQCMDVAGGSNRPGTAIQLWDCNGGDNQDFDYTP
jgi:hypothetical protein